MRQWDDWRCYRCNRWRPASEKRMLQPTPAGHLMGVCGLCAVTEHANGGHADHREGCPVCVWVVEQHQQSATVQ